MKKISLLIVVASGNLWAASPMSPMTGFYETAKSVFFELKKQHHTRQVLKAEERRKSAYKKEKEEFLTLLNMAVASNNLDAAWHLLNTTKFSNLNEWDILNGNNPHWAQFTLTMPELWTLMYKAYKADPTFAQKLLNWNDKQLLLQLMGNPKETNQLVVHRSSYAPEFSQFLAQQLIDSGHFFAEGDFHTCQFAPNEETTVMITHSQWFKEGQSQDHEPMANLERRMYWSNR